MICTVLAKGAPWPTTPYSSSKKPAGGTKHLICQYISKNPGCTSREITTVFGMDDSTIKLHLRHLRNAGKVTFKQSVRKMQRGAATEFMYWVAI